MAEHRVAAATGVVAIVGLLLVGNATGQTNWPGYAVWVLVGAGVLLAVDRRVALSRLTVWGIVVFGISHVAGGMVAVGDGILYQWWLIDDVVRYDNVQHAWGFGFVGRATWEVLRGRLGPAPADAARVAMWVVVLAAGAFGAANEILEYGLTLVLEDTNVGGYDNTARDLIANLVGGLLVGGYTAREVRAAASAESVSPPLP